MNLLAASDDYAESVRRFSPNARMYLLFVFLITLNVGIYGVIFNLYILSLGFKEDFLGLMLSISSASVGVFAIPSAFVCDRLGRKRTFLLSSLLLSVSLFILYSSISKGLLIASSLGYGLASSLSLVAGAAFLVENSTANERIHLFSMYSIIYAVSTLTGNMLGGLLPQLLLSDFAWELCAGYRLTLYISLASALLSLLPVAYIKEAKEAERMHIRGRLLIYRRAFVSKTVQRMLFFYCIFGIGWGVSLPYFNVFFKLVHHAGSDQIGLIFSLSQLFMMAGYLLVPAATERIGRVRLVSTVQALSIPFLLLFVFSSSLIAAAVGYVMRYMLMNMANPILNSFKLEIVAPEERSIANGVMWMACYTFVGIGTYSGGLLMAEGRLIMPFMLTAAVYLTSAALYYLWFDDIDKSHRR